MMGFSLRTLAVIGFGATFAIAANMVALAMVGKINEKLPENERMSYLGWDASVRRKYKILYPHGKLVYVFDMLVALVVACFPILLWTMGFFGGRAR